MADPTLPSASRKPGRPKTLAPRDSIVSASVSVSRHTAIVQAASAARVSTSEFLNRAIARVLKP